MLLPAALALVSLLLAAPGPEAPPRVDLTWRAPGECPDGQAVQSFVAGLLREPAPGAEGTAVARATVTRRRAGWELRLELQARHGRYARVVRDDDCRVLARAAALLIAIHLDPLAVTRNISAPDDPQVPPPPALPPDLPPGDHLPQETGESAPTVPAPMSEGTASDPPDRLPEGTASPAPGATAPAPDDLAEEIAAALPSPRSDMSEGTAAPLAGPGAPAPPAIAAHLRLDGGLDVGILPDLGGHVGLFAGVSFPRVRLELGLVGAPLRIAPAQGDLAGGRFDRLTGAVRVCPLARPRPAVALGGCLGLEVGAIRGVGRAVADPIPQWAPWLGFTLGPAVRWQLAGPVGLWFAVEGLLAVGRPVFTVRGDDEQVFRAGRAGVRASLGFDLQFGPRNR